MYSTIKIRLNQGDQPNENPDPNNTQPNENQDPNNTYGKKKNDKSIEKIIFRVKREFGKIPCIICEKLNNNDNNHRAMYSVPSKHITYIKNYKTYIT